ncbi:MAG: hypothetical protein U0V70_19315 [Terriglobia bacterium]
MLKKYYLFALATLALIPVVTIAGMTLVIFINPEIAVKTSNYVRNFHLLNLLKHLLMIATFLLAAALWFLTCFFLLKSKKQSYWWLPLALLGPFGLIVLMILSDEAPASNDLYQEFLRRLKIYQRIGYEIVFCLVVWVITYQIVVLKRYLLAFYEAARTGTTVAQVFQVQNASSGMWAFSEGLEELFLVVAFYLLWPIIFNLAARVPKVWAFLRG